MFVGGLANISSQGVFEDSKLFYHTVWRHCAETDDPECVPQKNEGKTKILLYLLGYLFTDISHNNRIAHYSLLFQHKKAFITFLPDNAMADILALKRVSRIYRHCRFSHFLFLILKSAFER